MTRRPAPQFFSGRRPPARPALPDAAPAIAAGTGLERLDWLLRFPPHVEARFEAETSQQREKHLQGSIVLGLLFYNAFDLTSIYIMSDILALACLLRLAMTAVALVLVVAIPRVSGFWREVLVTAAMIGASAVPAFLSWMTDHPLKLLSFSDMMLTVVFGTTLLMLRFQAALLYAPLCIAMGLTAVCARGDLPTYAMLALSWQIVSACCFMLTGNWLLQKIQRESFLRTYQEQLRSEKLDALRKGLLELSLTDALTGLANRRHLDETLAVWFEDARQEARPLAVLMLDVDHFKRFNDHYGHPAGDACLRQVAQTLRAQVRCETDLVARYGGEEFAVLLREGDPQAMAGRLLEAIRKIRIPHDNRPDTRSIVTVSIGIAVHHPETMSSAAAIVSAADEALYAAKQAGRDRHSTHGDGVAAHERSEARLCG